MGVGCPCCLCQVQGLEQAGARGTGLPTHWAVTKPSLAPVPSASEK